MIAAEISFPAGGRFHATPWGRHVNEGPVEWPVEPWRLLRALVATWFHKAYSDVEQETLVRLVTALTASPPSFRLPAASLGHTRHYMPVISGKNSAKTKIFDAFVHIADGESLGVRWDVDLPPADRTALGLLLERLGYLGRAESIVEARLLGEDNAPSSPYETRSLPAGDSPGPDEELVQVLAPLSESEYRFWREGYLQAQAAAPVRGPRRAADLPPPVPATIFDALLADTGALQAAGWSLPPGACRMAYVRPADAFQTRPVSLRRTGGKLPTVARYAIATAVSPSITAAVSVGDRVHQALVSRSPQPVFTGCDAAGVPLRNQHRHASILSECDLPDDRIRFLTVYAPDGLDAPARHALSGLRSVWGHGGHDLQLVLLGFGEPADFAGPDAEAGQSRILGESAEWVSLTPFVPTRHGKTGAKGAWKVDEHGDQIGGPKHDLRRLLRLLHPENDFEIVREEAHAYTRRPLHWLQFQRRRSTGEGTRAGEFGFGFRVRFSAPVRGPLAVGYGAHFGLGLFVPVKPE